MGESICRTRLEGQAVVSASLPKSAPHYRLSIRAAAVGESVTIAGYPRRRWYVATARMIEIITSANLGGRIVTAPMIIFGPALDYGASGSPVLDRVGQVIAIAVASDRESNSSIAPPHGHRPPDLPQVCERVPKNRDTMLTAAGP